MSDLSSRMAVVKPSASMAVSLAAKALRATGVDVIDLSLGEPDFPTPAHIVEAAHEAARSGQTLYTAAAGAIEVREAVAGKFRREDGLDYRGEDFRMSTATSEAVLTEAVTRINRAVTQVE